MNTEKLTPEQRNEQFHELWNRLPGRKIDKMRLVSEILYAEPVTIRIWRMKTTTRPIPEAKLRMLQRHFAGQ